MKGGCSHWPQTGTGVWIAHNGLASKLGWTSNLLCLWSFEEKRQLPTSCLPEWARKLGASTRSQTTEWSMGGLVGRGRENSACCLDLSFWIFLWNNVRRGKQQQQQQWWRCRGKSVTFTSSLGNDALASGIRLKGMWVGRINRYTRRQKYRGRWMFFRERERECWCRFVLWYWWTDVLCHVSVMMADMCAHMHVCLPHLFPHFHSPDSPLLLHWLSPPSPFFHHFSPAVS